jgi:hypothetical protein
MWQPGHWCVIRACWGPHSWINIGEQRQRCSSHRSLMMIPYFLRQGYDLGYFLAVGERSYLEVGAHYHHHHHRQTSLSLLIRTSDPDDSEFHRSKFLDDGAVMLLGLLGRNVVEYCPSPLFTHSFCMQHQVIRCAPLSAIDSITYGSWGTTFPTGGGARPGAFGGAPRPGGPGAGPAAARGRDGR